MNTTIITIIVSASVSILTAFFAWVKWKKEFGLKISSYPESVSAVLIKERIEPFASFLNELKIVSNIHKKQKEEALKIISTFLKIIQNTIYGKLGLVCSHDTRQILLYVRLGCQKTLDNEITLEELHKRIYALHYSLRSDLGIEQPDWENAIDKLRNNEKEHLNRQTIELFIQHYDWNKIDYSL